MICKHVKYKNQFSEFVIYIPHNPKKIINSIEINYNVKPIYMRFHDNYTYSNASNYTCNN